MHFNILIFDLYHFYGIIHLCMIFLNIQDFLVAWNSIYAKITKTILYLFVFLCKDMNFSFYFFVDWVCSATEVCRINEFSKFNLNLKKKLFWPANLSNSKVLSQSSQSIVVKRLIISSVIL